MMEEYINNVVEKVQHNSKFQAMIREIVIDELQKNHKIDLLFSEKPSDQLDVRKLIENKFEELKNMIIKSMCDHIAHQHFGEQE
jgi:hypothetical protein